MSGAEEDTAASAAAAQAADVAEAPAAEEAPAAADAKPSDPPATEEAAEKSGEEAEASEKPAASSGKDGDEQAENEPAAAAEEATEKEAADAAPAADTGGGDSKAEEKSAVQARKTPRRRNADTATTATTATRGRKKGAATGRRAKKAAADDGEETESDVEKKSRKRAKTEAPVVKRGPGRPKKIVKKVVESEESEDDEEKRECERRVDLLPDEVKAKFGEIVWAKMTGYPYWPSLITDPRLLPKKFQKPAMKDLESKFFLFFYATKNFAAVLHKNIAPWNDEAFNYREGHPEKDSKAPKRRQQLMEAIEEADKELLLPVDQRVDGLLKPQEKIPKAKPEPEASPVPPKRRTGKSPTAKSKKESAPDASAKKGKRGKQSSGTANEAEQQATPETIVEEEEDDATGTPALSKEEIKAKVASRRTPSRKKLDGADAGAKKPSKTPAKGANKSSGASAASKADIDTKRKKEIELVVPHKSVKSADIREATEEAAKRNRGDKMKGRSKDKAAYKVGDLAAFASKMTRLQAQESAKNNDELVVMLGQLLKEEVIYRSDVERSGLAAIIALLRKNTNPTVASSASAARKHMIKLLNTETAASDKAPSKKKHGADGDASLVPVAKKPKLGNASVGGGDAEATKTVPSISESTGKAETNEKKESPTEVKAEPSDAKGPESEKPIGDASTGVKTESPVTPAEPAPSSASTESTASNAKANEEDVFKGETSLDKNRVVFVEMLGEVLKVDGPAYDKLAKEIEGLVFDRYKESNGDYRSQARLVIFGLRDNAKLRERLFAGTLHCLEIAYASDEFFKGTG